MKYLIILMFFLACDFSKHDEKRKDSTLPDQDATLLGIDSDKDGIRDDVQVWIDATYANQPVVKLAARQYAQAHQISLATKDNKIESIEATKLLLTASDCLLDNLNDTGLTVEESFKEFQKLERMYGNTKERILAEEKISENFHGSSYALKSKKEACNFNPKTLKPYLEGQNETLLGIDSDNDGVRDDVQNWIDTKYPSKSKIKSAVTQFAKSLQNGLANIDNKNNSISASRLKHDSYNCLLQILRKKGISLNETFAVIDKIRLMHTNTKERILAEQKQSEHFGGNSLTTSKSKVEACNFGPEKIEKPIQEDQNATLLGIDSDNDGVRDDVQSWIDANYINTPLIRSAAHDYAKTLQSEFANKDNKQNSIAATRLALKSGQCLMGTMKELGISLDIRLALKEKLRLLHTNTKERIEADAKVNQNFSGNTFEIKSKAEACGN